MNSCRPPGGAPGRPARTENHPAPRSSPLAVYRVHRGLTVGQQFAGEGEAERLPPADRYGRQSVSLVRQPESVPNVVVFQRGAFLVTQKVQVPGHRAPGDAELGHEIGAVGRFPACASLPDHLDHAPDAVVLRSRCRLHFPPIFLRGYAVRRHTPFTTLGGMVMQAYRARKPKASPLWQCLFRHFDAFLDTYEERYQPRYGFLRPIVPEVVNKFLDCGDLDRGFARVRCDHCKHEYLLAFSCKGRWFCPSCHQKKVQLFGALLRETILFPVPHLHFTLGLPKMLRPCFRFNRDGRFHVMPEVSLKPVEELFRARVITFLIGKGLLPLDRAQMLRGWMHSGFNVHRGRRVLPDEREDLGRLAQYIVRNPFSVEKMQVNQPGGSIIYRSGMNEKIRRNFEVFTPCDFIAAITQHIPDKSFQLVRYYGWYSNKMRGPAG